jgi:hypothetical protein
MTRLLRIASISLESKTLKSLPTNIKAHTPKVVTNPVVAKFVFFENPHKQPADIVHLFKMIHVALHFLGILRVLHTCRRPYWLLCTTFMAVRATRTAVTTLRSLPVETNILRFSDCNHR